MDAREETIQRTFAKAALILKVQGHEIASLKFRSNTAPDTYLHLYELLRQSQGITLSPVKTDTYEGWTLVTLGESKAFVVQHESGLEILYVAGSIASLIELIPRIVWCWRKVSDFRHRHFPDGERAEIRRLDEEGQLIEDTYAEDPTWPLDASLNAALSDDLKSIKERLIVLELRVKKLEEQQATTSGKVPTKKAGGRRGKAGEKKA